MEYEEPEDEEVQMHMTYVPADDAGYPDEDEGPINMVSPPVPARKSFTDWQDADFDGELPTKKRKKNKKGKNKAVEPEAEEVEDENLTVADKAKKVKKAMEEYKALDHEDMVSHFYC
jgi:protein KRI1